MVEQQIKPIIIFNFTCLQIKGGGMRIHMAVGFLLYLEMAQFKYASEKITSNLKI